MNNLSIAFAILACLTVGINSAAITACSSKDVMNGVGYKASPNSCRKYVKCQTANYGTENAVITAIEKDCGDSLFWNQQVKNCVRFPQSDCYNGECDGGATFLFESTGACGAYFVCTNTSVSSRCCPQGATAFDPISKQCVFSPTCEYQCDLNITEPACSEIYRTHVMASGIVNPCKYEVHLPSHEPQVMSCGAGTNYNAEQCACLGGEGTVLEACPVEACEPAFQMTFEAIRDVSSSPAWIQNIGQVSVTNDGNGYSGYFDGNSRLAVVRFSNMDFGLPMAVKLRYRETINQNDMTVLSTGGDIDAPGLYIKAGNGRVTIGVVTVGGDFEFPLSSSATTTGANTWKEVVLYYNGVSLSGVVRSVGTFGSITQIPAVSVPGNSQRRIKAVSGALSIGYSHDDSSSFVGNVDDVNVWTACNTITSPDQF